MEKQVKTYIKALKKSINQERFLIRVAGLEYEVAQKLPHAAPVQENCGPGWERDNGRCGKNIGLDQSCFTVPVKALARINLKNLVRNLVSDLSAAPVQLNAIS